MLDPIAGLWITFLATLGSCGIFIHLTDCKVASEFYVYGKCLDLRKKKSLFWRFFLLPKKNFSHFYLIALFLFSLATSVIFVYYGQLGKNHARLQGFIAGFQKISKSQFRFETCEDLESITALLFTLILMAIQVSRRLYETISVSVFSSSSKINIIHYLYGHAFYLMAALSTICPILLSQTSSKFKSADLIDNLVTRKRALLFVLFIYVSHYQHKCHVILANLRKDKSGRVITEQHYAPSGGLFEYVSCPHFLTEIIIYLLVIVIQGFSNSYWNLIFLLVFVTQTLNAMSAHKWYKMKYTDYPKERKAIIPKLL